MFLNYCTYACRTIVFLAIVFMVGYIMVKNEKKIEKFVAERIQGAPYQSARVTQTQKETITGVFRNYLGRDPTPEEVEMMSRLMLNSSDVISIVDAVKGMDEYKHIINGQSNNNPNSDEILRMSDVSSSPLLRDLQKVDLDTRMDTYRKVIDVYQRVLERMPSNKELTYYAHKTLTDPKFTDDKLARILEGSSEYKILQKNQSNLVNGELPGNITDAQLTMDVVGKYKSVFGKDPNADTIDFLKEKYVNYKLDEIKFDNLLILLKQLDDDQFALDSKSGELVMKIQRNEATVRTLAEKEAFRNKNMKNVDEEGRDQAAAKPAAYRPSDADDNMGSAMYSENDLFDDSNTGDVLLKSKQAKQGALNAKNGGDKAGNKTGNGNCPYTDPFYSRLATAQGSCNFNGDVPSFDRDLYSEYKMKRNEDELASSCNRASYYLGMEADLFKNYESKRMKSPNTEFNAKPLTYTTEPTDAAALVEARQTSVGSILPQFLYAEPDFRLQSQAPST